MTQKKDPRRPIKINNFVLYGVYVALHGEIIACTRSRDTREN